MDRVTFMLLSWSAACCVFVASMDAGAIDTLPGRNLSSPVGGVTGPAKRTFRTDAGKNHTTHHKGRFDHAQGKNPRPFGPLYPWGTIWYSQRYDSQSSGRGAPAAVKQQNMPQPIVLNPDIFDPQPKDPRIIELSDSNYDKGFRAYKSRDYAVAYELLKTETRYSMVRATLGFMYFSGLGVTQDYSKAVEWFVAAARQGHVVAQKNLGSIYAGGYGVPQDYREAARWYLLAAESNDATAQKRLADMHLLGLGVPPDKRQAVKWYRRAAENGDKTAARYADYFVDQELEDCQAVLIRDLGLEPSHPPLIDGAADD